MQTKELEQKGVIITGASLGLGKEIAHACVKNGANILICARDPNQLEQTKSQLEILASPKQLILSKRVDLENQSEIDDLFTYAKEKLPNFYGLVNNAAITGPKGHFEELDFAEWRKTIETNFFASSYCMRLAIQHFKKQNFGKIVNLSGGGATSALPYMSAYAASKVALVRMTENLAIEVKDFNIQINALSPGALNTRMLDQVLEAGPDKVGQEYYQRAVKQLANGGSSLEIAASCCLFLLSKQADLITGKVISAVWDDWQTLGKHIKDLESSDLYTLRRILPQDRGYKWGRR